MNFKPMLAAKANPDKLRFPLYVQAKLDGIRCSIVPAITGAQPVTRTLKSIPNREIRSALSNPALLGLDGELIVGDPTAPDCYRRTSSFVMSEDKTGEPWSFHVFDQWHLDAAFADRYASLQHRFIAWDRDQEIESKYLDTDRLKLVLCVRTLDARMLEEVEVSYVDKGHEGVILRDPNACYKFGRASATKGELLKLKRFDDFEAVIVDAYEEQYNGNEATTNALGRTQRSTSKAGKVGKGALGGFVCEGLTDYEGVTFRVGTGFDRNTRIELWDNRRHHYNMETGKPDLIGKAVKIKHFSCGAKDKPRFPTFLGFRDERDF